MEDDNDEELFIFAMITNFIHRLYRFRLPYHEQTLIANVSFDNFLSLT